MKFLRYLIPLLALTFACEKKDHFKQSDDFNTLMGSNKSVWKFVETHEDYQNIRLLKALYEKNRDLQPLNEAKIPKVIHFIWIGPNPFPKESIENVNSWIKHHPDWVFKFWTDRRRPLPNQKMELKLISDFQFTDLKYCFEESDNYAEKSDLLRYELLFQEGGLYVDHDVKCFKSFAPFHQSFDLYCGLEPPHMPVLSSSVTVNNNVVGVVPHHPVLRKSIDLVKERWDEISEAYPGDDKESIIYRVAQRSWAAFNDAILQLAGKGSTKDIVFPAAYFNQIDDDFSLYAHHYYASTWFEDETKFERNVRRRLVAISRKNNQILLFNAVILTANLALFAGLFFQFRSLRRRRNAE
ncbi:MAG: hypothetical protein KDK64_02590 [Chlamydiia bacterium]|nr:hypothetical protein [Chlamydiia bacterium]